MHSFALDQAAGLRKIMTGHQAKIISVLSATPNHNQSRLITNLAASISQQGSDVLVLQTGTVDLNHYGVKTLPALSDVAENKIRLEQSVKSAKFGFLTTKLHKRAAPKQKPYDTSNTALNKVFERLANLFEVVLVDASLDQNHQLPLEVLNQHGILIQLSSDAASITEAYTLIKRVYNQLGNRQFGIVVSDVDDVQAASIFRNIAQVARNYMQVELEFFGAIPNDVYLSRSAKLGRAVTDAFPLSKATTAIKALAQRINYQLPESVETELATFI
jgi:flagellar biosynthesis protein FlhG